MDRRFGLHVARGTQRFPKRIGRAGADVAAADADATPLAEPDPLCLREHTMTSAMQSHDDEKDQPRRTRDGVRVVRADQLDPNTAQTVRLIDPTHQASVFDAAHSTRIALAKRARQSLPRFSGERKVRTPQSSVAGNTCPP